VFVVASDCLRRSDFPFAREEITYWKEDLELKETLARVTFGLAQHNIYKYVG